jgi:xanthine dehydrogenase accessory factor
VLVEPVGDGPEALPEALLANLVAARANARATALVIQPEGWIRQLLAPGQDRATDARLRSDRSGMEDDGRFIAVHNPALRLIVVGAVHIAQPLLAIARTCGYAPTLIDPRAAFGTAERFPGETILADWPDEALQSLSPDARTAIVTLTHDPKLDDPALSAALASPVFYIGALGSKKTHARRIDRLTEAGFSSAEIARIHAPVGLDIGARTPSEIAVSIMAQITATLRT